jgi:hypothetical protein
VRKYVDILHLQSGFQIRWSTIDIHAVWSFELLLILGLWESFCDLTKISWASDCGKQVVIFAISIIIHCQFLEGSCQMVQKARSCKDLITWWSIIAVYLEAALNHLAQVSWVSWWNWIINSSCNFVCETLHAVCSEWW